MLLAGEYPFMKGCKTHEINLDMRCRNIVYQNKTAIVILNLLINNLTPVNLKTLSSYCIQD